MNSSQTRISKRVPFSAAHHIPDAGQCANNHGHNWICNITVDLVSGREHLDHRGFVADVQDIKGCAFKYDHDDLNKYFEYPSTENVAQKIADDVLEVCKLGNKDATYIVNVHLIETENNSADASASNFVWTPPAPVDQEIGLAQEKSYIPGVLQPAAKPSSAKFIKRKKA